jgi:peroxiredoxin
LDVRLLAASADSIEETTKTVKDHQLTFPVAYGLDVEEVSSVTGAFYDEEEKFIHATGFLVNREGTIIVASYSTGAIGRLTPQDCLTLITYLQAKQVKD